MSTLTVEEPTRRPGPSRAPWHAVADAVVAVVAIAEIIALGSDGDASVASQPLTLVAEPSTR